MNRKYKHRGYQDSGRDDDRGGRRPPPQRNLTPEERIQRRSLRHAIDRDAREVVRCHVCGRSVENTGTIARDQACPSCSAPLHCCRTCAHFDSAARWQCRAEIEEPVGDKTKANECTSYRALLVLDATGRRTGNGAGTNGSRSRSNDPRDQFNNLFKR